MSDYFNRMAARSNVIHGTRSQGNTEAQASKVNHGGQQQLVKNDGSEDIEVHDEVARQADSVIQASSERQQAPSSLSISISEQGFGEDTTGDHSRNRAKANIDSDIANAEASRMDATSQHRELQTASSASVLPPVVEQSADLKTTANLDGSGLSAATGHKYSVTNEKDSHRSESTMKNDVVVSTNNQNQRSGRHADTQPAEPLRVSGMSPGEIQGNQSTTHLPTNDPNSSVEKIVQDDPTIKPSYIVDNETRHDTFAVVSTNLLQSASPSTPAKNSVEIKIGKIDLEIHQLADNNRQVAQRQQDRKGASASVTPGNNLSRYYLRGGIG